MCSCYDCRIDGRGELEPDEPYPVGARVLARDELGTVETLDTALPGTPRYLVRMDDPMYRDVPQLFERDELEPALDEPRSYIYRGIE